MRFKDPYSAPFMIAESAAMAAQNAVYSNNGQILGPLLQNVIRESIRAAIEEMMRQQYSDEDFEKDIGLRS